MKQGITVIGTLMNIKKVDAKEYDGRKIPSKNVLQLTILNDAGLSMIEISDKEKSIREDQVGKVVNFTVSYSVMNDKAYFTLVS